jgi:hypothetical protein
MDLIFETTNNIGAEEESKTNFAPKLIKFEYEKI